VVESFGFKSLRVSGSHHIFGRTGVIEQINLQNVKGQAKPVSDQTIHQDC
jgi:hypothetical protein